MCVHIDFIYKSDLPYCKHTHAIVVSEHLGSGMELRSVVNGMCTPLMMVASYS